MSGKPVFAPLWMTALRAIVLCPLDLQGTVYISKSKSKGRPAIYRFSLNASVPAPWQLVSPGDGEVPSFQVSVFREGGARPIPGDQLTRLTSTVQGPGGGHRAVLAL